MQIKIGAMTYQVVEIAGLTDYDRTTKLNGHIRYNACQICVEADMSEQAKRQTIWHEIIHGILTQAGDEKQDEHMIDVIAYGIMDVIQNNPWLAEIAGTEKSTTGG